MNGSAPYSNYKLQTIGNNNGNMRCSHEVLPKKCTLQFTGTHGEHLPKCGTKSQNYILP